MTDCLLVRLLLHPGGRSNVWCLVIDGELTHGGLQGLLVPSEVGGDGIVEQQQLLVHHLHLRQ